MHHGRLNPHLLCALSVGGTTYVMMSIVYRLPQFLLVDLGCPDL